MLHQDAKLRHDSWSLAREASAAPAASFKSAYRHVGNPDSQLTIIPFIRWDEKAGLQRDAIRSQGSTCSRHKEKETGYEKD